MFNINDNNIYFCKEIFIVVEIVDVVCMYRCLIICKVYKNYDYINIYYGFLMLMFLLFIEIVFFLVLFFVINVIFLIY